MSFMQPQVTGLRTWWEVDGDDGIHFFDQEDFSKKDAINAYPTELWTCVETTGYASRLSAPGYMDCTEWSVYPTQQEAAQALIDMYFNMPDDEMTEDGLADLHTLTTLANNKE